MLQSCTLTINSDWKYLPWKKINTRVLLLQKKIFEAAKRNDKKQINKIQNYLLNCNESKIFAIENIINSLKNYYSIYNQEKYICLDKEKFIILKCIFCIYSNTKFLKSKVLIIIEKVKEYLIYLCLQPEWQARLDSTFCAYINIYNNSNIRANKFYLNLIEIYSNNCNYNYNWNSLVNKLKPIPYIERYIKLWFQNKYYKQDNHFCILSCLLKRIYFIGIIWYQLTIIVLDNKYISLKKKFLNNQFIFINNNSDFWITKDLDFDLMIVSNILHDIKLKIFKKNYLNHWRFNNQLKDLTIISYIISCMKKYIINYRYNLYYELFNKIFISINKMIYYLKTKKHLAITLLNKSNININKLIYSQIILKLSYNYLIKIIR